MSGDKYLSLSVAGVITEKIAIQASAGAADAGKIVALDSAGLIDTSILPDVPSITAPSSENLAAGDWVNVYNNAGALNVRKADASGGVAKMAHGYVDVAVTAPADATVFNGGLNTNDSSLTIGSEHFLSATPGAATTTAPTTSGHIVQRLGTGFSATVMFTKIGEPIVRA